MQDVNRALHRAHDPYHGHDPHDCHLDVQALPPPAIAPQVQPVVEEERKESGGEAMSKDSRVVVAIHLSHNCQ